MYSKKMYLTDETITYVINSADLIYEQSTPDPTQDAAYKNVFLNEDFSINMGSYLDASVKEYYCEVVSYTFSSNCDGANTLAINAEDHINFTQLYSNLHNKGTDPIYTCDNARQPLTQFISTKNNKHLDDIYQGTSRSNIAVKQKTSFVCENFNQKTKHFRMFSVRPTVNGFLPVSTDGYGNGTIFSYGNAELTTSFSVNINPNNNMWNNRPLLKCYPSAIMYMTPIHIDKIPRLLKKPEAISLVLSSKQAIWRENDFGANCIIKVPTINEKSSKYKLVFKSLNLQCNLGISQTERQACNFSMHLVCYDWNISNYGYLGCKNENNCAIITSIPMTFNYQDDQTTASKIEVNQGSTFDINGNTKDINFKLLLSQMVQPSTSNLGQPTLVNGFLSKTNPECEFIINFDVYPI